MDVSRENLHHGHTRMQVSWPEYSLCIRCSYQHRLYSSPPAPTRTKDANYSFSSDIYPPHSLHIHNFMITNDRISLQVLVHFICQVHQPDLRGSEDFGGKVHKPPIISFHQDQETSRENKIDQANSTIDDGSRPLKHDT